MSSASDQKLNQQLLRRIPPNWILRNSDGSFRVTSQAFQNMPGHNAFSVYELDKLHDLGVEAVQIITGFDGYSIVSITVADAIDNDQLVEEDSFESDDRPEDQAHAHVVGDKPKRVKKAFAANCKWVINSTNAQ